MTDGNIALGAKVGLRRIQTGDLAAIAGFEYSVSVVESHSDVVRLRELLGTTGFWLEEAAAVAVFELESGRMVGSLQCYRSGPSIHGLEIGYVIHDQEDRSKGFAAEGLRLFSDHLFARENTIFRHQLVIEVWNTASWKVAERAGFVREGILRSAGFGEGDRSDAFVYSRTHKDVAQELASSNGPGSGD